MASFLSEEYMTEATDALGESADFTKAIEGVELGLQFVVSDHPEEGELPWYLAIGDGSATMGLGELEDADVTVTNTYETAVGISKGDLNTQMAFMTGKLKAADNMAKLMMNQGVLNEYAHALSGMAVEY